MRKNYTLLLVVLIISLAMYGCGQQKSSPVQQPAAPKQAAQPATPQAESKSSPQAASKAATPDPEKSKLKKVIIASPSESIDLVAPLYMAAEKGLFAKEGIELENIVMKSNAALAAMTSGEVGYTTSFGSSTRAAAQGLPLKVIMTFAKALNWSLLTAPEIKTVEQLKGKTIGTASVGDSSYQATSATLRHLGLDPKKDVNIIAAGPMSQRVPAFMQGAFQASAISEPYTAILKQKGFNELIFMGDVVEMPLLGLATTDKLIAEQKDEVKAIIRAALKGTKYFKDNSNEAIDYIAKKFKVDRPIAEASYTATLKTASMNGEVTKSGFETLIEMSREEIGLKAGEVLAFDKIVNLGLLREVQKELGL